MVGVKLASYYGCLLVRPPELAGGDDPERPMFMDDVVEACGAEAVDWNMKVECCGGAFSVSRTSSVLRMGRAIIEDARRAGAEAIVVACPLCHTNLDLRQKAMESRGEPRMPVLFITQVVGLALGLSPELARPPAALHLHRAAARRPDGARRSARRGRAEGGGRRRPPRPPRGRPRPRRPRQPSPAEPVTPDAGGDA